MSLGRQRKLGLDLWGARRLAAEQLAEGGDLAGSRHAHLRLAVAQQLQERGHKLRAVPAQHSG